MKFDTYDYNLNAYDNVKNNILADKLAKNRWGNKFKKLFNRHNEQVYTDYPAYSFMEGMLECTGESGTVEEQIEEYTANKEELSDLQIKTSAPLIVSVFVSSHSIKTGITEFQIENIAFEDDNSKELVSVESETLKNLLDDYLDDNDLLADEIFETTLYVDIENMLTYLDNEIASLQDYDREAVRANEDLELIDHLGLCETLASEISSPHKIKSIYFRFHSTVSPTELTREGIFIGYDPDYAWWEEEQFEDIVKNVKNFKNYCTFVVGVDDGSTAGTYTESYVYVDASIFELSGQKLYWFVKVFLDIKTRTKKSVLESFVFALVFVISIYLTAVSGNPAWMKIATILVAVAGFSGALSPELQLMLAVVMFAYGVVNVDLSTMSNMQLFNWAIKNVEMLMQMNSLYEQVQMKKEQNEEVIHKEQELAMEYIYTTAYNQYDSLYNSMYDYTPNYK